MLHKQEPHGFPASTFHKLMDLPIKTHFQQQGTVTTSTDFNDPTSMGEGVRTTWFLVNSAPG